MALPSRFVHSGAHRLIARKFSQGSVLETLSLPATVLSDLSELDAATNERKIAEGGKSTRIGPEELLFGVPEAQIVNAAFTHPGPYGGRFHSDRRGAWYAGLEIETSIAEVSFHKRRFLGNGRIPGEHVFEYVDFQADFAGTFHHLEPSEFRACLQPDPIPGCYAASQALAKQLLYVGSNGITYPSVRNPSGICLACFRPALVFHPRRAGIYRITLEAGKNTVTSEQVSHA